MKGIVNRSGSRTIVPGFYTTWHSTLAMGFCRDSSKNKTATIAEPSRGPVSIVIRSEGKSYCEWPRAENGSTSSQLGPAATSTLRGTLRSRADVISFWTTSASLAISLTGASNTSSSWI
jgi:hypothetical protein